MSNGICILAQNNENTNYIRQAYALALSILKFNPNASISLLTTDKVDAKYKNVFDNIIDIPWGDLAQENEWKIDNRWKVYHCTPYRNTLVFDADMIVLENLDYVWDNRDDLIFTGNVKTFRNQPVTNDYYRKTFTADELPNVYSAMYKFKKCNDTKAFFILLELIMNNYEMFYSKYAPKNLQKWSSVDLSAAIALKILSKDKGAIEKNSIFNFTHMKSRIQGVEPTSDNWTDFLSIDVGKDLMINGYKQTGILHYVDNNFLTDDIINWLEEKV